MGAAAAAGLRRPRGGVAGRTAGLLSRLGAGKALAGRPATPVSPRFDGVAFAAAALRAVGRTVGRDDAAAFLPEDVAGPRTEVARTGGFFSREGSGAALHSSKLQAAAMARFFTAAPRPLTSGFRGFWPRVLPLLSAVLAALLGTFAADLVAPRADALPAFRDADGPGPLPGAFGRPDVALLVVPALPAAPRPLPAFAIFSRSFVTSSSGAGFAGPCCLHVPGACRMPPASPASFWQQMTSVPLRHLDRQPAFP